MQSTDILNLPPIDTKENWSLVQDIIHGDRIPGDAEQIASRTLVDEIEADLRRLEVHRVQLERALVAVRSSLAPIRKLPRDLLIEIFTGVVEDHTQRGPPWFLLRICHQWRDIVLSAPSFWTVIYVDDRRWNSLDVSRRVLYQTTLEMLETSLSASASAPLSVTIDMRSHNNKVFRLLLLKVLTVLSSHRSRIRHLGCFFRDYEHIKALKTYFFNAPNACPLLEELDIIVPRKNSLEGSPPSLLSAPNIRRLRDHLTGSIPNAREGFQSLQYQRLTHLSCVLSSNNELPLLGHLPSLIECSIFVPGDPFPHFRVPVAADLSRTTCPRVRYLNVNHPHLLLHLILPCLEALAIFPFGSARLPPTHDDVDTDAALKLSILSIVQRSHCRIRALGLVDRDVQSGLLALDALRHVETLAVFHADYDLDHADHFHLAMDAIAWTPRMAALTRIVILRSYTKMEETMLSFICAEVSAAIKARNLRFGKACAQIAYVDIWGERLMGSDEGTILSEMNKSSSAVKWRSCWYLDDGLPWDGPLGGGMWKWLSIL